MNFHRISVVLAGFIVGGVSVPIINNIIREDWGNVFLFLTALFPALGIIVSCFMALSKLKKEG